MEVRGDAQVRSASLLRRRAPAERLDVAPFVVGFAILAGMLAESGLGSRMVEGLFMNSSTAEVGSNGDFVQADGDEFRTRSGDDHGEWEVITGWAMVLIMVAGHAGSLLAAFWSVRVRAKLQFKTVDALSEAKFVIVEPVEHCGVPAICPLVREEGFRRTRELSSKVDVRPSRCWFEFQKNRFQLISERSDPVVFELLDFPVNLKLTEYLTEWKGYEENQDEADAKGKWGKNEFDIPFPALQELFIENALSPFFLFQLFCVALWCLDEFWYYSVFTLVMLVLFELTVCKQRQQNLSILRGMRQPPYPVYVYRGLVWKRILSSELLPGDICSLARPQNLFRLNVGIPGQDEDSALVPCDVLLLQGSCIVNEAMLTGESVPKMKESVASALGDDPQMAQVNLDLLASDFAQNIVLGGTRVIQHTEGTPEDMRRGEIPAPPDRGCIGFCLRTGFYTSQGSLMRTILFSTEHVTVGDRETFFFILVLLGFAVVASIYVLIEGLKNEKQSRWKLFLHCTMIITSVVPPELPMELSLAVNTSLTRLIKLAIFCTEPYRIPFAGKLDLCCFDKTGTLTSDAYFVKGVAEELTLSDELTAIDDVNDMTAFVIAGCHQLVLVGSRVDGDPMEQAAVRAIGWGMTQDGRMLNIGGKQEQITIVHRHPFSSSLKRMTALIKVGTRASNSSKNLVVCKGAPEIVESLLEEVPENYTKTYKSLMLQGGRVLALAYKSLSRRDFSDSRMRAMTREDAERGLKFAGLLVLDCPLKDDTAEAVSQLTQADHRVVIITGDNALTACDVARQLDLMGADFSKVFVLDEELLRWRCLIEEEDSSSRVQWSASEAAGLLNTSDGIRLVLTGPAIVGMQKACGEDFSTILRAIVPYITVFARVSPEQKEIILASMKESSLRCLMCGDGTNDVGALKQADVGVSIINSPEQEDALKRARGMIEEKIPEESLEKMSAADRIRAELHAMEAEQRGSSVVQLGDASIASPFTSKSTSIMATVHIIRQGRCTLVTTIQMYKILALNCLISAYSLSSLYLFGVKQGDTQATIVGLLIAGLFMCLSWAEPLEDLAPQRPVANIFSRSVMFSLVGQLFVHFTSLFEVMRLTRPYALTNIDPDADFEPNSVNTAVFLVGVCMQCNVFGANYRGRPFMQSLMDNKAFHRILFATWGFNMILAMDILPGLVEFFELVHLPTEDNYSWKIVAVLLFNTAGTWGWESVSRMFFD